MPGPLRDAYLKQLPRLQAEHETALAMAAAFGSGHMKKAAAREYLRMLTSRARGPQQRRPLRTMEDIQRSGIKIVRG